MASPQPTNTLGNKKRDLFFRRYLHAISRAIDQGHNVQGYLPWALFDNYEWGTFDVRYGVFANNFTTQKRELMPGSQFLIDTIAANRTTRKPSEKSQQNKSQ